MSCFLIHKFGKWKEQWRGERRDPSFIYMLLGKGYFSEVRLYSFQKRECSKCKKEQHRRVLLKRR